MGAMDVSRGCFTQVSDEKKGAGMRALLSVCLKQQLVFPFSPSAFQVWLQTSIFQARNRTTGAAMSLIEQSDVKNRPSPRDPAKIHLCRPLSRPDTTNCSVAEPGAIQAHAEHSSSAVTLSPLKLVTGCVEDPAAKVSKSAQA